MLLRFSFAGRRSGTRAAPGSFQAKITTVGWLFQAPKISHYTVVIMKTGRRPASYAYRERSGKQATVE